MNKTRFKQLSLSFTLATVLFLSPFSLFALSLAPNLAGGETNTASASIYNGSFSDDSPSISYSLIANSGDSASWASALGIDGGNNINIAPSLILQSTPASPPPPPEICNCKAALLPSMPVTPSHTPASAAQQLI